METQINPKKGPQFHVRKTFGDVKDLAQFLPKAVELLAATGSVGVKGQGKLSFIKGKPILLDMNGEYDRDIARLHIHAEQVQNQAGTEAKDEAVELFG